MPKVHYVKARKDYPQSGVQKGDMCYVWELKTGPTTSRAYRQKTPPKRSQLTTSEYLGTLYDIEDRIAALTSPVDESERDDIVQALRDLAQEQDDKYENMPDGLKEGSTGQLLEERRDACNTAADELESIDMSFDEDEPEADDEKEAWQEKKDEFDEDVLNQIQGVSIG